MEQSKNNHSYAIGIDLGTTYSCVAIMKNNKVEIIANDMGNRTTPSYVAFNDTDRLIGDAAKNQSTMNPKNTIYDIKRLMGRLWDDESVQNDIKNFSFNVSKDEKVGKSIINVKYKNINQTFTPEEISAMILSKMKSIAESYIGYEVKDAVITVPAYFNDNQRQATKDAGKIAGLNVIRIINEPTAAAIAYGLDRNLGMAEQNILIFDCGGGTFDVSLLSIDSDLGIFEVKATGGDTHLGGEDFTNRIIDFLIEDFKKRYMNENGNGDGMRNGSGFGTRDGITSKMLRRLFNAAERAKKILSSTTQANIEIESFYNEIDYCTTITRAKFEELCSDLFKKCMIPVEQVLIDANMSKADVDEIILVGGSTRIPKIQSLLETFFIDKKLNKSINPDEAVAYGAAVQAAILNRNNDNQCDENIKNILLLDVTPLTIGIETAGGIMTPMIKRNTTIPTSKTDTFSTNSDNQNIVNINILQGERRMADDNILLGKFELSNIPLAPRGAPRIEITYDIDADCILNVTAIEKSTGEKKSITINNNRSNLSKEEIDKMIIDANKFKENDEKIVACITAKNDLENYIYNLRDCITNNSNFKDKLTSDENKNFENLINDTIGWIDQNRLGSKEEFEEKMKYIQSVVDPVIKKIYSTQT
jgi:L1 cell adhesion molecule like protein